MNIKKFLFFMTCIVFGMFLVEQKTDAIDTIYANLEKSIRNNEIDCVLIRRNYPSCQIDPLSIKRSFCLFALIDKILGGNGLLELNELYFSQDNSIFTTNLIEFYDKQDNSERAKQMYNAFVESLKGVQFKSSHKRWTFLLFNEMFFSSKVPLDSKSVEEILYLCYTLTQKHKNLIICINFLHAFDNYKRPCWLPDDFSLLPLNEDYISSDFKDKILDNGKKELHHHLANYSLIVWNGEVISCYRKTTYCDENNAFINGVRRKTDPIPSHAYEFGNWESHIPFILSSEASKGLVLHHQLSQLFNDDFSTKSIVMRICADSLFMPYFDEEKKMLLLTGNGCPYASRWLHKTSPNLIGYVIDAEKNMFSFRRNSNWYSEKQIYDFMDKQRSFDHILNYLKQVSFTCKCNLCTIHRFLDDMLCEIYIGHSEFVKRLEGL